VGWGFEGLFELLLEMLIELDQSGVYFLLFCQFGFEELQFFLSGLLLCFLDDLISFKLL
jgi:hypothetical protein